MHITRRLEFDAGHRIPDHRSQCRHLHGHRYAIEITLSGEVINAAGQPENGMVMDFSEVKAIAQRCVVDNWDHAFLAYSGDTAVVAFRLVAVSTGDNDRRGEQHYFNTGTFRRLGDGWRAVAWQATRIPGSE